MHVRQYQHGDEEYIAQIHNAAFKEWIETLGSQFYYEYITPQDVLNWLNAKDVEPPTLWVAEDSGTLVGYAHCDFQIASNHGKIPVLFFEPTHWEMGQSKVAILPAYQGHGVGVSLIEFVMEYYESLETRVVIAFAYNDNLSMETLLTKLGFSHPGVLYYSPYSEEEPLGHDTVYATRDLTSPIPDIPLNSAVSIRPAKEQDADELITLFQKNAFWIEDEINYDWISEYFSLIHNENGRIFVAELDDRLVGAMDYMRSNGRIGIPGVLPKYRKLGIGYTLFFQLLTNMQNDGIRNAIAETGIILTDAIRMYEKFQFNTQRKRYLWFKTV
jgi:GNAT superfamily N-acetyltransferase